MSLKPASVHNFIGILSSSPLPSEDDAAVELPTLHVLARSDTVRSSRPSSDARSRIVDHLASAFSPPDEVAAELLLLSLLAHPVSREPLVGGLTVNLVGKSDWSLEPILEAVVPVLVSLPLSISTLHKERFEPSALVSTSLDAGLLQLAHGTLLLVDESGLGDGGKLDEKAYANLRALNTALTEQRLRYVYPYMENLFMDCAIKGVVLSERSSLTSVSHRERNPADLRRTSRSLSRMRRLGRIAQPISTTAENTSNSTPLRSKPKHSRSRMARRRSSRTDLSMHVGRDP